MLLMKRSHSAVRPKQKTCAGAISVERPLILYSGRIRPHKNLDRLIEAFAVLESELAEDERHKNLKLIIIGDELSKHQYLRLDSHTQRSPAGSSDFSDSALSDPPGVLQVRCCSRFRRYMKFWSAAPGSHGEPHAV